MSASSVSYNSHEYSSLDRELAWKLHDQLADKEGFRRNVYWVTGDLYRGYWSHNKREGNGMHTYRNGNRYEGQWRNGKKEGQGTFWVAVNGKYKALYRGAWNCGKWHGKGILYGEKGQIYEGDFENGERCGTGKQTYWHEASNGYEVYIGQWSHDKRDGKGIMYLVSGDRYEGSFKDDMREGKGVLFYRDKCARYEGLWLANVPVCGTYTKVEKEDIRELPPLEMQNSETLVDNILNATVARFELHN